MTWWRSTMAARLLGAGLAGLPAPLLAPYGFGRMQNVWMDR
jgi:hypothetical protein